MYYQLKISPPYESYMGEVRIICVDRRSAYDSAYQASKECEVFIGIHNYKKRRYSYDGKTFCSQQRSGGDYLPLRTG